MITYKIKNIKTIKGHSDYFNSLLLLNDGRIVSCSNDKTIKVWNIYDISNDNQCDIVISDPHNDNINSLCLLAHGNIVSCSEDKSIKIWKINKDTYECLLQINNAHNDSINKVVTLIDNQFASSK